MEEKCFEIKHKSTALKFIKNKINVSLPSNRKNDFDKRECVVIIDITAKVLYNKI